MKMNIWINRNMRYRLVKIRRSNRRGKKLDAIFEDLESPGTTRRVSFGAAGYEDYTQHHSLDRRAQYRARHRSDRLKDPTSPGALAWHILWGPSTSREENIKEYRRKFRV